MQLKMSLPERPGWIFVIPGFRFYRFAPRAGDVHRGSSEGELR
jgi:hypothetical protein